MSRQNVTREKPKRQYQMTRRAELEEQTRLRITESTVALHGEPAEHLRSAVTHTVERMERALRRRRPPPPPG